MKEELKIDAPKILPGDIFTFRTPFGETAKWVCVDVVQAKSGSDMYDYLGITNIPPAEPNPECVSTFKVNDDTFFYEAENVMFFRSLRQASKVESISEEDMNRFYQLNWERRYYNYLVGQIKSCSNEIILGQIYDFYNNGSDESSCQVVFVKQSTPGKISGFILLQTTNDKLYYSPGMYDLNSVHTNIATGIFKPAGFLSPKSFDKLSFAHDISTCGFLDLDCTIDLHELVEKSLAEKAAREQEEAIKDAVEAANSKHEVTTHVENDEQPKPKKKRTSKKKDKKDA